MVLLHLAIGNDNMMMVTIEILRVAIATMGKPRATACGAMMMTTLVNGGAITIASPHLHLHLHGAITVIMIMTIVAGGSK